MAMTYASSHGPADKDSERLSPAPPQNSTTNTLDLNRYASLVGQTLVVAVSRSRDMIG